MPVFVHLTSENNLKKILENGIKANKVNDEISKGIFCMPVTKNFMITHQWLRELKRNGQNNMVGIYFKLKNDEPVWFGHYNKPHVKITASEAVNAVMDSEDGQGFEVIIPRSIAKKEIYTAKHMSQKIGWRYYPEAHGKKLCLCPACIQRGTFKAARIRENRYYELISQLRNEKSEFEILNILSDINDLIIYTSSRLRNVNDFDFLLHYPSHRVKSALAYTLSRFKSEKALPFLLELLIHENEEVRRQSAECIMHVKGRKGLEYLESYKCDFVINEIIEDYRDIYFGDDD